MSRETLAQKPHAPKSPRVVDAGSAASSATVRIASSGAEAASCWLEEAAPVRQLQSLISSELQCSICRGVLHMSVLVNCGHQFCLPCVLSWLQRQNTCPVCRSKTTVVLRSPQVDVFLRGAAQHLGGDDLRGLLNTPSGAPDPWHASNRPIFTLLTVAHGSSGNSPPQH